MRSFLDEAAVISGRLRIAAVAVAIAIVPLAARAQLPSPSPSARLAPGTYRQVDPSNGRVLKVGNAIAIRRIASGRLHFALDAVRAYDLNTGEIAGTISATHAATFASASEKCRLYFTANDAGFVVSQDLPYGTCGFGYGVVASGIYVRQY